ncbi:M48 family metallopeptidase [Mangrovitalea sediminis]|uniref:M48 family metallopeptidase n=1 Tax=Mangrovitalea sediminis TaxID=1982043 RepID=UPI000BE5D1A1|nr:M48 family metallopeptidase [Mangrovitalea sediminis]
MTNEQFEALVARLEIQARQNPRAYQFRVFLLALLGNLYLGAILLLCLVLLGGLAASVMFLKWIAVKLILVVGVFLLTLVRALWVKVDPPEGLLVRAGDAPELFSIINDLRRQLKAPAFHSVLVTDELNAAVYQAPRFGIFGGTRNYLVIGLPLMKALTVEQFRAVLAHEFGHLSRGHGRVANWLYRQRLRWSRLMGALEAQNHKGAALFKPFLRWYSPYFNAYSFPLARANEYEADATSARLTSPQAAAEALTRVEVVGGYLSEKFWPSIHRQASETPRPAFAPNANLGRRMLEELDEEDASVWLDNALASKTTMADTHPSLSDRLQAIGATPQLVLPKAGEAADQLLHPSLERITETLDSQWRARIQGAWEQHYEETRQKRERLAELNQRIAEASELEPSEAYERAMLTESVANDAPEALAQLRALHPRVPDDAVVCYALGARLLETEFDTAKALLERAMTLDEEAITHACELLRDYYWQHDDKEEAHRWHERLVEQQKMEQKIALEREQIRLKDKFDRHDLSEAQLATLLEQLRSVPGLRKVYLVKKRMTLAPERPLYVIGFTVTPFWLPQSKKKNQAVMTELVARVKFPGFAKFISLEGNNYRFGRKFRWMRGSRIL